jgi:NAD-reducing hydrogenase large subunit
MNKGVEAVAKKYIKGRDIPEGVFNRLEHVIRAYDPCLSCSTHAVGKMPLKLELISSAGEVIKEVVRG